MGFGVIFVSQETRAILEAALPKHSQQIYLPAATNTLVLLITLFQTRDSAWMHSVPPDSTPRLKCSLRDSSRAPSPIQQVADKIHLGPTLLVLP